MKQAYFVLPPKVDKRVPTKTDLVKRRYKLALSEPFAELPKTIEQEGVSRFVCHLTEDYYLYIWRHHELNYACVEVMRSIRDSNSPDGYRWETEICLSGIDLSVHRSLDKSLKLYKTLMVDPHMPSIVRNCWPAICQMFGIVNTCSCATSRNYRLVKNRVASSRSHFFNIDI